jgi:hypothetical protein
MVATRDALAEADVEADAELLAEAETLVVAVAVGAFVGVAVAPALEQAPATIAAAEKLPTTRSRTGITGLFSFSPRDHGSPALPVPDETDEWPS